MRPPATTTTNGPRNPPEKKNSSLFVGVFCRLGTGVFDRFFPTQELDESLSKLESSKGLGDTIALDEKQIKQVVRCLLRFG